MTDTYRYIGRPIPRRDGVDVVTGGARFLNDLEFKDLLYGKVLRSPHAHAVIKSIDAEAARRLPGVKAIITWETIDDWTFGNPPIFRILDRRVRFVGDAVALVAAETKAAAEEALKQIHVTYEVLPAVFDDLEAVKPGAPRLYDQLPGNVLPLGDPIIGPTSMTEIVMGDVEKGFAEADTVAEGYFAYENIPNPIPMESPGAIAHWESPHKLTLWVTTQAVWQAKSIMCRLLGPGVDIRVIGGPCGGSFGTKIMSWQVQCYATALGKATGRPVKVIFSKEEHLAAFVLRPATRLNARVGMKRDGTVTAVAGDWMMGTGYYSMTTQCQVAVGCGEAMIAVRCKNWNLKPTVVCTNRNASGIVRGFGGQELKCALIPLMSQAMARLDLDPFQVLRKNFIKPGDGYFWRDGNWYDYRGIDYSRAMDKGAEAFGWQEKWKGWLTPTAVEGPIRIGVGVGVHGNADIGEDISEAYVKIDEDASVVIYSCLAEHGTGQRSNAVKAVAEVLRLPIESVTITPGDTLVTPLEWGPVGSRGTYAILTAVINAAEDALQKLLAMAAALLGTSPSELSTSGGIIRSRTHPEKSLSWQDVLRMRTVMGHGRFDADYTLSNCMMSFVEVAADIRTGQIELKRVVNATDAGKIIDPQGLTGQLNGCLGTAGIDSALFEETILDQNTGHIVNANMIDYKWRTSAQLPVIDNVIMETPVDSHRFHAVGIGEIATSPGPSAVLMATTNAIGRWLHEYPVTPERILAALGNVPSQKRGAAR